MVGWFLLVVFFLVGILCLVVGAISNDGFGGGGEGSVILGLLIVCVAIAIPCCSYHGNIVSAEAEYAKKKNIVADIKSIIDSEQYLNLKDMEMGKELALSMKELRQFEAMIEVNKKSPFCLYRPTIEITKDR